MIEIELSNTDLVLAATMMAVGAGTTLYYFALAAVTVSERLPAVIHAWRVAGRK